MFKAPLSPNPTGEVWLLSDHPNHPSVIADGPLAGTRLHDLMQRSAERIVGKATAPQGRFPVLIKFLHARESLSVQVHPTDAKASELEGPTATGKTEAWVVLEADPTACVHAGLTPAATPDALRRAIQSGNVEDLLYAHAPSPGDCFFLNAGTVHAIGGGIVLFEVQQTSDLTYRLYDWKRTDPKTGQPRELHVDKALASINYAAGPCRPNRPTTEARGRVARTPLVECPYFDLGRWEASRSFRAGAPGECRILTGIEGQAVIRHGGKDYPLGLGDVWLIPAETGAVEIVPSGNTTILECGLPKRE
jgi:mannose-6-phosphate isomerase